VKRPAIRAKNALNCNLAITSKPFIDGIFGFGHDIDVVTKLLHKSKERGARTVDVPTPEDNVSV
jgi:hypothetical protein